MDAFLPLVSCGLLCAEKKELFLNETVSWKGAEREGGGRDEEMQGGELNQRD